MRKTSRTLNFFGDARRRRRPRGFLWDRQHILVAIIIFGNAACPGRFFVAASASTSVSGGGGGGANYHPYLYDMTTPQFTPDGRLLQVEYAGLAPSQSLPLVVVRVVPPSKSSSSSSSSSSSTVDDGDLAASDGSAAPTLPSRQQPYCLVVAARRRKTIPSAARTIQSAEGAAEFTDTTAGQHYVSRGEASAFERILLIPVHSAASGGTSVMVVGMSGVLSDCLLLLRNSHDEMRSHFRTFGRPFTIRQFAHSLANQCQQRAFGGGIRPFGASMILCGMEGGETAAALATTSGGDEVGVWQTDPSGSVRQLLSSTSTTGVLVVGGSEAMQSSIRRKLQDQIVAQKEKMELGAALRIVVNVLQEELDRPAAVEEDNRQNQPAQRLRDSSDSSSSLDLEAAILSPSHGDPYKLTPSQIDQLLAARRDRSFSTAT